MLKNTITRKMFRETVDEMSLELNRDIVEAVKDIKLKLAQLDVRSPEALALNQERKLLNQERIKALKLELIQGGKED